MPHMSGMCSSHDSLPSARYCPKCGLASPLNHRFCRDCGTSLNQLTQVEDEVGLCEWLWQSARSWLSVVPRQGVLLAAGILAACLGQLTFILSAGGVKAPGTGVALLIVGMILFAMAALVSAPQGVSRGSLVVDCLKRRMTSSRAIFAVCWGIGAILAAVISFRILLDASSGLDLLIWAAVIVTFALPFLPRPAGAFPLSRLWRKYWPDVLILVGITAVFLSLNIRDLDSWKYSAIGDEYAFYNYAIHILDEGISEPFKPNAVDNSIPS